MKIGTALAFVASLSVVGGFVVYLINKPPTSETPGESSKQQEQQRHLEDPTPTIAKTGPYPKAAVDQPVFAFPPMQANAKASHSFTIRNEGEAPLILARGKSTCTCTMSSLAQKEIPPGGSAEVTLEWHPKAETEDFRQTAKVKTNDPEHPVIDLSVTGAVQTPLRVTPSSPWHLGEIPEGEPKTFEGYLTSSSLDSFKILSLECTNPEVTMESIPITDAEKETLKSITLPKSGYKITGTIPASTPIGSVFYQVNIKTDVENRQLDTEGYHETKAAQEKKDSDEAKDAKEAKDSNLFSFQITVTGRRTGPLTLFGPQWLEDKSLIEAGRVDPAMGKKITLSVFARDVPEEGLKILEIEAPEFLKINLSPDPKFKGKRKRYLLEVEFLPAKLSPEQQQRFQENAVKLKLNHVRAPELEFRVVFTVN